VIATIVSLVVEAVTLPLGPNVSAALGNAAYQGTEIAVGNQKKFNWAEVVATFVATSIDQAVHLPTGSQNLYATAGQNFNPVTAAVQYAAKDVVQQSTNVAFGLQKTFNWTSVAVSGVEAGAVEATAEWANGKFPTGSKGPNLPGGASGLAGRVLTGAAATMAAAATQSALTGQSLGKSAMEYLPGVIGNTIGEMIASGMEQQSANSGSPAKLSAADSSLLAGAASAMYGGGDQQVPGGSLTAGPNALAALQSQDNVSEAAGPGGGGTSTVLDHWMNSDGSLTIKFKDAYGDIRTVNEVPPDMMTIVAGKNSMYEQMTSPGNGGLVTSNGLSQGQFTAPVTYKYLVGRDYDSSILAGDPVVQSDAADGGPITPIVSDQVGPANIQPVVDTTQNIPVQTLNTSPVPSQVFASNNVPVDDMGQPLYGRSHYNSWSQLGTILSNPNHLSIGAEAGRLWRWATYTVPDAKRRFAEQNYVSPKVAQYYQLASSPIGALGYDVATVSGGDERTKQLALDVGSLADVGLAIGGAAASYRGVPAVVDEEPGGWSVGDDINSLTKAGNEPAWSTVRSRFWKNEAANPQYGTWDAEQLDRMSRGYAPQRYNLDKGDIESMDLSHEPVPFREGGKDIIPRWPQDHAAVDPFRRPGY